MCKPEIDIHNGGRSGQELTKYPFLINQEKLTTDAFRAVGPHQYGASCTSTTKKTDHSDEVVKVVNYIKSNALRSRIFSTFCEAMDSDYKNLLFHTEVRWLSKGKVLNRFISMKNEIMAFIDNEEINFPFMMSDVWWLRVSFLGDIFDKLNSLNLNLQGAQENIITISTKLKAFKEKLSLWNLNIVKENFASFPMVQENPSKSIIKKEVEEILTLLSASFDKYFPYLDVEKMEWVVNPFMHCEIQHLEEEMQENLIDLKNDLVFKRLFTEKELSEFWLCLNSKFPKLSNAAIESLLPFGSSYLCEQGFSTLTEMKSKKVAQMSDLITQLMMITFINGSKHTHRFARVIAFADDVTFVVWSSNIYDLQYNITKCLIKIKAWCEKFDSGESGDSLSTARWLSQEGVGVTWGRNFQWISTSVLTVECPEASQAVLTTGLYGTVCAVDRGQRNECVQRQRDSRQTVSSRPNVD
ncbi:hypothetical protein LAZ67_X004293 [Cordylochernes scorpioides]|uniref:Uncharacterized protein n=1 Tax=Cordylochernes scorpioides TaxID=51811 RepID=A0ABY6LUT0_9ARAC|nr:hypothetical protein LAZ67_X004293 [Cordylochernes scorpioides]